VSDRLSSAGAWQAVCDGLDQAVWLVDDRTLRVVHANAAAARLVGRPQGAMRAMAVQELAVTPEDVIFWSQPVADIAAGISSNTMVRNAQSTALVPVYRTVQAVAGTAPQPDAPGLLLLSMLDRSEQEATQQELESLLSQLRATLDSAADGVLTCDLHGEIHAFNQRLAQIWQLPQDLLVQRDDAAVWAHMQSQVQDGASYRTRMEEIAHAPLLETTDVVHLRNGTVVEQRSVAQLLQGRPAGRVYSFRDITAQVQAQAGLRLAAEVFESSLDAIFIADAQLRIVRINPGCERMLRASEVAVCGRLASALWHTQPEDDDFMAQVGQAWVAEGFWEGEKNLCVDDGICAVHLSWVALKDEQGRVSQSIGFMRDLTAQHAAQRRIEELAYHDALTGLPNRLRLGRTVASAIESLQGRAASFAILFLDLDRFKIVNDSLGHLFGDRVLQLVSARVQGCLRQADMLCRLGGDEFVVYLHGADAAVAEAVARRMLDEMRRPFELDEMDFSIQASIGISLYPQDGTALDDLIKQADAAMYGVKERGRGSYGFYRPQMNADLLPRMKMEHAMRQAIGQGHMAVHYQPQVDIATGALAGAEALVRWRDPELGEVPPGKFVPLAEESGYIITLGAWVMEQAIKEAAYWLRGGTPLVMAVNVSALEFRQAGFIERVTELLARYGLPAHLLELELTETILLQDAQDMEQLVAALARLGVGLSIDDFGTGYSSLAYLKKLKIHRLKIDKSFVQGLPDDEGDRAIVQAITSMGQALRIDVVAEGVETQAQHQVLQELGCQRYQGFLFAPGLPAERFRALIRDGRGTPEVSARAIGFAS